MMGDTGGDKWWQMVTKKLQSSSYGHGFEKETYCLLKESQPELENGFVTY